MSEDLSRYHIKQLSIFAENKPGRIAAMAKVLKENEVNILGFSIAEGAGCGVIRVIVDKPHKDLPVLLEAWGRFHAAHPDRRLTLVTPGDISAPGVTVSFRQCRCPRSCRNWFT